MVAKFGFWDEFQFPIAVVVDMESSDGMEDDG